MPANLIIGISVAYVAVLFALAWIVDRRTSRGAGRLLGSPLVYTLSLSVYCTAWTFYGAVGLATRNGLEFATIYIGPTLVFIGWWWLLRKIVRIGRAHRITSIADLISSRYGKSGTLAVVATVIAVVATTPYIALQLQSVTLSYSTITGAPVLHDPVTAFWAATGMAAFTILFGTRTLDANERHYGVVAAIAAEAVIKLMALIAVGLFAIFGLSGGLAETIDTSAITRNLTPEDVFGPRWLSLLFLAAAAIICLPRQFQVTVVENGDERHLATASWMFPLYLLMMSVFVMPIAAVGLATLPEGSNPDMFVLTLPLAAGRHELAILAFIGGFSAATSMVIVSTIALSTMISNHIIAPITVRVLSGRRGEKSGDLRQTLLFSRRISIALIMVLGYSYFLLRGGSEALAATGLIAFCGVAQFLPSVIAGLFWRGANRAGALAGLIGGFLIWCYTLFLPSFEGGFVLSPTVLNEGPWGLTFLKPQALAGLGGGDPIVHATGWSLGVNIVLLLVVSLMTRRRPLERLQATLFVGIFGTPAAASHQYVLRSAPSEDLFILAQRILGTEPARRLFSLAAQEQGRGSGLPEPTPDFITKLERNLAGSIGAASAHALVSRTADGETISLPDLMEIADEAAQLMATTQALAAKSREAEEAARQLRIANISLQAIDVQKDEFLSQVSHELRTPMTSIRSFSQIMRDNEDLSTAQQQRFVNIIHDESQRLTRLLDEILDMKALELSDSAPPLTLVNAEIFLQKAIDAVLAPTVPGLVTFHSGPRAKKAMVTANADRLVQVFVNVLGNAIKHNTSDAPWVRVESRIVGDTYEVIIEDNGGGVRHTLPDEIFEKFTTGDTSPGSSGLGLPISRKIMQQFGGDLELLPPGANGARFRISLDISAS